MKRIATLFLSIAILFSVVGCGKTEQLSHRIIYNLGTQTDIFIEAPQSANVGDIVELRAAVLYDADIHVYINDSEINKSHYDSDYWGYSFTMPDNDVTVTVKPYTKAEVYGIDEDRFSSGPVPPLNQENSSIDLDKYLNVISFAKMDIDDDGIVELCTMQPGPTSGLYTLVITASVNGITKYKNTFNLSSDIAFTEKDGVPQVLRNGEPCRMYVKDKCIVIDGLDEEYEGYWGGADWNYNLQ